MLAISLEERYFRLEACPGTGREFTQQVTVEAGVNSQTLGDGQDDLPMCDGRTDFLANVDRGQQRPLLMAGRARASLLAGEGDEPGTMLSWSLLTIGATNSGEAFLQITTLEKDRLRAPTWRWKSDGADIGDLQLVL